MGADSDARLPRPPSPAPGNALFLDVDGTLIEIADRPEAVVVRDGTVELLERWKVRLHGALALVSGRPLRQLDELFAPLQTAAAGLHGGEIRNASGSLLETPVANVSDIDALSATAVEHLAPWPGVLVEHKRLSLALHYRNAPEARSEVYRVAAALLAEHPALHAVEGKCVLELKPSGFDKGVAVRRLLELPGFRDRVPIFVGDDVTDEDGFRAARDVGGIGVLVGNARRTEASYRLDSVASTLQWLALPP